jgi:hypothetical protein
MISLIPAIGLGLVIIGIITLLIPIFSKETAMTWVYTTVGLIFSVAGLAMLVLGGRIT